MSIAEFNSDVEEGFNNNNSSNENDSENEDNIIIKDKQFPNQGKITIFDPVEIDSGDDPDEDPLNVTEEETEFAKEFTIPNALLNYNQQETDRKIKKRSNNNNHCPLINPDGIKRGRPRKPSHEKKIKEYSKDERYKRWKKYEAKVKQACHICGKMYVPRDIDGHMNTHKGLTPYICEFPDCEKSFASVMLQKRHFRLVHNDLAPYECEICGKRWKIKSKLDLHRSYHLEPSLPCDLCGKLLRNQSALTKHIKSHAGKKPFECQECGKHLATKYSYRIHLRGHTKVKLYQCTECEKSFAHNSSLKKHREKVHNSSSNNSNISINEDNIEEQIYEIESIY